MRITGTLAWWTALGGLLAGIAGLGVRADQVAPDKGHDIIQKTVAALGGDRFLHMQNRVASGRLYGFFRDQMSGEALFKSYTEYITPKKPGELAIQERELLGKKLDYSYLFLPDQGWDVTYRGARPVPGEDWERYVRTTRNDVLYILRCRLREPGMQFDYVGSDVLVGRHVELVDITDASDQVIHVSLDHNTLYPIHASFTWFDEKTREHNDQTTDYDKYRDIGNGVMWPLVVERERNGYKTSQIFAESVQSDQAMPPSIFELPSGAKILKKVE